MHGGRMGAWAFRLKAACMDLSDGFALPGPRSQPKVVSSWSSTNAQLRNDSGTAYLEITPAGKINLVSTSGVTVTGPLNVTGALTSTGPINLTGNVTVSGTVSANGISLTTHRHTNVANGGGYIWRAYTVRYRKLSASNDFSFGHSLKDFFQDTPEAPAQAVATRIKLWAAEWYLDLSEGTPFMQSILGKHSKANADSVFQDRILNTQGVTNIRSYSSTLDVNSRMLTVSVTIDTIYGPTALEISNYANF